MQHDPDWGFSLVVVPSWASFFHLKQQFEIPLYDEQFLRPSGYKF